MSGQRCEVCGREASLTFHHLIPKTLHGKKWYRKRYSLAELKSRGMHVCRECHRAIHKFWDEKTLGKEHNTPELILGTELIRNHIRYMRRRFH